MMKLRVPWHDMRHLGGGILSDSVVDEDTNKTVGSILHSSHPTGRRISLFDGKYEEMQRLHGTTLVLCGQLCGLEVEMLYAGNDREIDAAFAKLSQRPDSVLMIPPDSFFFNRRAQIVTIAARHALPVIYPTNEYPVAGGLISYGPDITHACQQTGVYTGRILKGENPANLPVMQPTKFELVLNLQTARLLGITVPPTLLARADEVIE